MRIRAGTSEPIGSKKQPWPRPGRVFICRTGTQGITDPGNPGEVIEKAQELFRLRDSKASAPARSSLKKLRRSFFGRSAVSGSTITHKPHRESGGVLCFRKVSQACLSEPFGNTKPSPGCARTGFVIAGRDLKGSPSEAKVIPGLGPNKE